MLFYLPGRFKINKKRKIDDEKCFQSVRFAVLEWSFIVITCYQCMGGESNNSTPSHNGNEIFDAVLHFGIIDIL